MDLKTAEKMVGSSVQVKGVPDWGGILERVTKDGWAGIRQPTLSGTGRYDEVQVERLELDPT